MGQNVQQLSTRQNKFGVQYGTLKKNLKIPCVSHCLGIILYSSIMEIKKKHLIIMLVQNRVKIAHLPQQGPFLEISYITPLSDTGTPSSVKYFIINYFCNL